MHNHKFGNIGINNYLETEFRNVIYFLVVTAGTTICFICKKQTNKQKYIYICKFKDGLYVNLSIRLSYLNDSYDVGQAAFQEVSIDEDAKSEAGAAVAVDHLPDEPGTCGEPQQLVMGFSPDSSSADCL